MIDRCYEVVLIREKKHQTKANHLLAIIVQK